MKPLRAILGAVAVAALLAPPAHAAPAFTWPLAPRPAIVNPFDPPEHNWLPGHRGVDLGGFEGQPVVAAGDGIVVFAGMVAGKPVVSIDHAGALRTTYEPVTAVTSAGTKVRRGEIIGTLESGHHGCAASCLHWGLRRGRDYLDPSALVRTTPIRLKPLRPA